MGAENILPIDPILVTIAGKDRKIRYTMKSLAWLASRHGTVSSVLTMFGALQGQDITEKDLHGLADFISAGLVYGDSELTPEFVETELDLGDIIAALPKFTEAFTKAMGVESNNVDRAQLDPPKA